MSSDAMKKLGVAVIVALFVAFIVGFIALMLVANAPLILLLFYGVLGFGFLTVLAYEAWERFKEIDEGLEDAVNNY